ncbi:WD40 repeat domain-containing protein [Streptomyces sp. NPDC004539]|uniref:WD40 repeat domain-containing protein n=1 Tax=Streptomyces sp. NPDC004539 TaxID=3154280 RepID=UPI0033A6A79A
MATALSFLLILHKGARRPVDPQAVLSATVDPTGLLGPVTHLGTKVTALAQPRIRLGIALPDRDAAERARTGSTPDLAPLVSVAEAVGHSRLRRSWRLAAAVMALLTGLGTGGWAWQQQEANTQAQRDREVADLLARTDAALGSAPQCAASYALKARTLHPGAEDTRARLLAAAYTDPRLHDVLSLDAASAAVAYTADGRSLAVAEGDSVLVYDAGDKKLRTRMPSLKGDKVTHLVPLGNRGLVAMTTSRGTVRLWDLTAPTSPARLLADGQDDVIALATSRDGTRLAWAGTKPVVTVATVGTPEMQRLPVKGSLLTSLAFVSAKTLVVGSAPSQRDTPALQALDLTGQAPPRTLQSGGGPLRGNSVGAIAVQPQRHLMLTGNFNGTLNVWDTRTLENTATISPERGDGAWGIGGLALGSDGRTALVARNNGLGLTSGSPMNTVQAWDLIEQRPIESPYFGDRFVFTAALALRPGTNEASIVTTSAAVTVWRAPQPPAFDRPIVSVLADPLQRSSALALDFEGTLTRVRADIGTTTTVLRAHRDNAYAMSMALSPQHDMLAISHTDASVSVFSYPKGRLLRTLKAPSRTSLYRIAFAADGDRLAAGGDRGTVYQWNPATGNLLSSFGHTGSVAWLSFTGPGNRLVATYHDGDAKLISLSGTQRPVRTTQLRYGWGSAVPDQAGGFYVGFADGSIAQYTDDLTAVRDLPAQHTANVVAMALSPDTRTLATAGMDEEALLTDPRTGTVLLKLPGTDVLGKKDSPFSHAGYASLAFTADGRHLVLGTTAGHTQIVHLTEDAVRSRVSHLADTAASDQRCR